MDGDAGPVVGIDGQAGDVAIGHLAGGNIYNLLADLPPGVRQALADAHEAQKLFIIGLERQGDRTARLEQELRAYTTGEAVERMEQWRRNDERQRQEAQRHQIEQGILMDGLDGIRDQIAEQAHTVAALRAEQRRTLVAFVLLALIILGLLIDRAVALWLAMLALGTLTTLARLR